jgi:peroxiredoxin
MGAVLAAAAVYNLAWGGWVVLDPGALFRLGGLESPLYPQIWQCVGMIVGVYGVGYAIAATAPLTHWPIVLVGLLGKVLGPVGFAAAVAQGQLPWSWGWTILTNDLVWWIPFALILVAARRAARRERASGHSRPAVPLALRTARAQNGESLLSLSRRQPRLVVCLRHLGCTFCRESLADLARLRPEIERSGTGIVLVHPSGDEAAAELFRSYGLADLPRFADPDRVLYRSLGLARGSLRQVLGPRVVWRGITATLRGHRLGRKDGDVWQMPGVFLVDDGRIVEAFRHRDVAERPDYRAIAARLQQRPGANAGAASS